MCVYSDILDSRIWKNYETNLFFIFFIWIKIKTNVYAWTCDEQPRTCKEYIRTFKHIQENLNNYYHALILNSHHGNTKNKLGKGTIPSCKIHMVEENTFDGGPKGRGKEELGEGEWVSINTLVAFGTE